MKRREHEHIFGVDGIEEEFDPGVGSFGRDRVLDGDKDDGSVVIEGVKVASEVERGRKQGIGGKSDFREDEGSDEGFVGEVMEEMASCSRGSKEEETGRELGGIVEETGSRSRPSHERWARRRRMKCETAEIVRVQSRRGRKIRKRILSARHSRNTHTQRELRSP